MKTIYFDSVGGASGDMILSCLLDLGADLKAIESDLKRIVKDSFSIEARRVRLCGFDGMRVTVKVSPNDDEHDHAHHHHRNLNDIEKLIRSGKFSASIRERAIGVFRRLAQAESKVHGVKQDKIHFHEVGALDSIIDIVGSCIALEQLGAEQIACGPLPLGCGTIKCAHGILPSPAPATVELLRGFAVEQTDEPFELVTPTGAVLLTTLQTIKRTPPGAVLERVGCGYGHSALNNRPNLLRAFLLNDDGKSQDADSCLVMEFNIDDMAPELTGHLFGRLHEQGALDVFITPVQMKKNRPGAMLTVLAPYDKRDKLLDLIFCESTTFGVREYDVRRTVLPRRFETVKTPYGAVRVKIGSWKGKEITHAPEYEDCRKLAEKSHVPLRRIYETALEKFSVISRV